MAKDTLVVVTATVSGQKGDGQVVNMHVSQIWIGWTMPVVFLFFASNVS